MELRHITIGGYPTSADDWTLCEWKLSDPQYRKNFITIPGLDGDLDLSDAVSDRAVYGSRTFTARLELSAGTRISRDALISRLINKLDGTTQKIVLPDDPYHYISGRVSIGKKYSTPAHACITVSAICDPWRYCDTQKDILLDSPNGYDEESEEPTYTETPIENTGRMPVKPMFSAIGGDVIISPDGWFQYNISAGSRITIPDIILSPGDNILMHCGDGEDAQLRVQFREAIL